MADQTAVVLTDRDLEVFVSLLQYRYLSTPQLCRLHFPSMQTTTRRARLLANSGYLTTFRAPATQDRLVALASRGAEAVAIHLNVPLQELDWDSRRSRPKDTLFLRHFLAASDFRITLTLACAMSGDVRMLGFLPEHVVEPAPRGAVRKYIRDVIADIQDHRRRITHAPDGVFALQHQERCGLFFLEIDRGTTVLSNPDRGVLKMVRFYLSAFHSDGYQRYREDFGVPGPFRGFRVLIVVPSEERLQNIRRLCGSIVFDPPSTKRFIWLTTDDCLQDRELLTRRWVSLDPADTVLRTIRPPANAD